MTDSFVQVNPDGVGKKMQTVSNVVGADTVHAEAVYIVGTDGSANYTVDSKARVSNTPYLYDVVEDKVPGSYPFVKLGYNIDVDNVEEDLWSQGGKYVFPTAPMGMEIFSADAQDSIAGTGIQKAKVHYLDDTFTEQIEEVELNGGVVALSAANILRVNALYASQVGSNKVAAGLISVRHLADTPIYCTIAAGATRSRDLIFTVPLGNTMYITDINLSTSSLAGGHYGKFTLRANFNDLTYAVEAWLSPLFEMIVQDQGIHIPLQLPIKVPALTDLIMSVISDTATANLVTYAGIRGWIE